MEAFNSAYEKLNPQQKKAVDTLNGPVLVVAGPGTGKTQILTLRIANILSKTDANPENILALTFTETAARNMRERLMTFIGTDAYKVKITTFHSFCNDVIQNHPEKFLFTKTLTSIDELGRFGIVSEILKTMDRKNVYQEFEEIEFIEKPLVLRPFGSPTHYLYEIIRRIDELKREYISPEIFKSLIQDEIEVLHTINKIGRTGKPTGKWSDKAKLIQKNIELLEIYRKYENRLKEEGKYDFADMIGFVVNKFKEDDVLLGYHQEQYSFILVDEYQDTNGSQNEVLKLLGSWDDTPNIFAVGDDDQAIYRFQGANLANIINFVKQYPSASVITITTNYRSVQPILDAAQSVIKNNSQRLTNHIPDISKELTGVGENSFKTNIQLANFSRGEIEYLWICEEIKKLTNAGTSFDDIAIIFRKNKEGEMLLDWLTKAGIPVRMIGKSNILEEQVIMKLLNLFKLISNPLDSELMAEVLGYDFLKIDQLEVFKLIRSMKGRRKAPYAENQLFDAISTLEGTSENGQIGFSMNKIVRFRDDLLSWQSADKNLSFVQLFDLVINKSELLNFVKESHLIDDLNSVKTLFDWVKQRNGEIREYKLSDFLDDISVLEENSIKIEKEEFSSNATGVNLMTAHSSKGLEFEHVFIPRLFDGNWGNNRELSHLKLVPYMQELEENSGNAKEERNEDERRLFFVALTRAKKVVHMSCSQSYIEDGKSKSKLPSQFIEELDQSLIMNRDVIEYENKIEDVLNLYLEQQEVTKWSEKEKEFLLSLLENFKLSVTALNNYLKDPKEFLYKNLLKVPAAKSKNLALGTAVHFALESFYRRLMQGESPSELGTDELFDKYTFSLRKEFLGEPDFFETLDKGKDMLKKWYENQNGNFVIPLSLEYRFSGRSIFLDDIALTGAIDKIESIDRENKTVRVIDYKTGKVESHGQIYGKIDDPEKGLYRQLVFYKILGELDSFFPYTIAETQLEFVKAKNGKIYKEPFSIPDEDVSALKVLIKEVMAKIRRLEF